ncbi:hypothetical protein AFE_1587 [Acidithiobacillus ferrooxidans ATCC 23270]|uniref:Uncharacterized protein n=1 Tax=Acidithiobacillus ferrooxidans (strain ATCC 23270 / DSM 14882 / CIP 104768 / NCIMB 8455) TaxID=243159 RepID=B7JAG3_ACIF2|nr:hypothetical protein AFE_1587 [Acidithiobacillus ferrooxidans ATCC 23270]
MDHGSKVIIPDINGCPSRQIVRVIGPVYGRVSDPTTLSAISLAASAPSLPASNVTGRQYGAITPTTVWRHIADP